MQVYADNAATTRMSDRAVQAMLPLLQENFGNPSSLHSVGQRAKEALENARDSIAADLGVSPKEIYFTSGGSEADNQAIRSAAAIGRRKGKTKIISSAFEHHAVLHTLAALEKEGFTVELLPVHENGIVRPAELEAALDENTCLVTIMAANNEIGTLQPVAEIGKICRAHGVLFHTDAVQAVGHTRLNITQSDIDLLSLSAHKFHGPKGAGVLYARRGVALTNVIEGGAQERGKRAGTENVPAIAGMAAALHAAMENLDRDAAYVTELRRTLEDQLSRIPESRINGDRALRLPGTLNMCFAGIEGESLLLLLDQAGIAASSGSACTSGSLDPSHVLLAIGVPVEVAHGSLRLSLSGENTPAQVAHIAETVPRVVAYLRSISPVWEKMQNEKA